LIYLNCSHLKIKCILTLIFHFSLPFRYANKSSFHDRKAERYLLAKGLTKQDYEIDNESISEKDSDTSSFDKTPNATFTPATATTATATTTTAIVSSSSQEIPSTLVRVPVPCNGSVAFPENKPPLASDEDASEGSLTPPFINHYASISSEFKANSLASSDEANIRNIGLTNEEPESRNSWHFIDSPCNSVFLESKLNLTRHSFLSLSSKTSRTSQLFDLKNSQSDPLISGILNTSNIEETDRLNEIRRADSRYPSLFVLYPLEEEAAFIENRPIPQPPKEFLGHRLLFKCLSLKLDLEIEPIFASIALYDAKEKKKISENFYFDLNSESLKKMLHSHIPYQDVSTLARSCIFNITFPSSDIFLVIKLEKVLQGDVNDSFDHYIKDDKNRERLKSNASLCCERLGKYRQVFAWTAVYLMDIFSETGLSEVGDSGSLDRKGITEVTRKRSDSSSLNRKESLERAKLSDKRKSWTSEELNEAIISFQPVTLTINSFFKHENDRFRDEDLFKFLIDLKRSSSLLKRFKSISGLLKIDISPCPEEQPKYCLTPELVRLHPYPDDKGRPIKEVIEFPQKEVYHPYYHYRNILFIYPKNLNFTNRQGSARNITCKIQLMSGEDEYNALPVIFGKSGCPEFSSEAFTSITYHNKSPDFSDEIKIKLPAKLNEQHHLLFTFYHISCQRIKQNDQSPVETAIGYTWLPIYKDGRLQTGSFGLPVMMEKPPTSYSYLTPSIQIPNTRWVDNHKDVFTINIEAVSSLHSQDIHIDHFLRLSTLIEEQNIPVKLQGANIESEFKSCILSLSSANLEPLIKFFPLIMNKLVKLLVRPPNLGGSQILNIGQTIFESMASVFKKVSSFSEDSFESRNSLLTTFVHYQCLFPHPDVIPARLAHSMSSSSDGIYNNSQDYNKSHVRSNSNPNVNFDPILTTRRPPSLERAMSLRSSQSYHHNHTHYHSHSQTYHPENNIYNVTKGFVPLRKLFHEELLLQWVVASGTAKDLAIRNAWVFFDLIIKSATENLALTGGLHAPRKMRFSEQFMDDLSALVISLTSELVNRLSQEMKDMKLIHGLNHSLAFFIRDLWSIADRGSVFNLIKFYCKEVSNKGPLSDPLSNQLISLKLDFLRIICNYEHFVALNLPFNTPLFPSTNVTSSASFASLNSHNSLFSTLSLLDRIGAYSELSDEYRHKHFLVGLSLDAFSISLEINNASIHNKAVNLIRSLLTSHDWNSRYAEPEIKSRICSLYLPLLGIVIDALPQLYDWKNDVIGTRTTFKRIKDDKRKPIFLSSIDDINSENTINAIDQSIAMTSESIFTKNNDFFHPTHYEPRRWPLREETTRDLLICFIWVLKNTLSNLFRRWLNEQSLHKLSQLIEVLDICVSCFEYKGKKNSKTLNQSTMRRNCNLKAKLEDAIRGLGSARRELILRRRDRNSNQISQSFSQSDALRWRKDSFQQTRYTNSLRVTKPAIESESEANLEKHLLCEVTLTILETIESIIFVLCQDMDASSDYYRQCQSLVGSILQVVIHALSTNQCTHALQNLFYTQRSILTKFPNLLFEERLDHELLSELLLQLLRHCSSSVSAVRSQASASLYTLMRQNFKIPSNFAQIKMQITMSLSSLVGTSHHFSEQFLRRSLKTILIYAVVDKDFQDSNFPEQVQDLVFNLHMILSDTIRMKEYQEDPEMLIDLMYRIAKGYQHSPDLRLTWLANMAQKHIEKGNHAEAAQCFIHSSAMVAEYLHLIESKSYLPTSCGAFHKISSNILEESTILCEVPTDKEGLFTGKSFSENGLITLLEKAANSFSIAGMYEAVNEVYKILLPIVEAHRDYKKLALIHGKLQDVFTKIEHMNGKRVFGTYFRVGFYGSKFGDLDREEFVYKEPSFTKLPEIAHRLEAFYSEQFGSQFVEVIKDSNTVDVTKCDPEKAYLQITYVEPHFDSWELDQRTTFFDKNYNISKCH